MFPNPRCHPVDVICDDSLALILFKNINSKSDLDHYQELARYRLVSRRWRLCADIAECMHVSFLKTKLKAKYDYMTIKECGSWIEFCNEVMKEQNALKRGWIAEAEPTFCTPSPKDLDNFIL